MDLNQIEQIVLDALKKIEHPTYKMDLYEIGMFDKVIEEEGKLKIYLKAPDNDRRVQIAIESQLRGLLNQAGLPKGYKVRFIVDESIKPEDIGNKIRGVKNIILIGSGKGGVGKSTVAANLAVALMNQGFKVGIIDADVYGPSLGKLFGFDGKVQLYGDGKNKVLPVEKYGLKIMSFSFLLEPGQAVIWRGPMLGKAMEQFLFEVDWGELDYLLIDLPPGTGDVQLSLSQFVEVDGAIVVTTPQNVAIQDASRALTMFQQVKIPVLGIIENMSEFICPHCGKPSHIFSKDGGKKFAQAYRVPFLGAIPLEPSIMESGEEGKPVLLNDKVNPDIKKAYDNIASKIIEEVAKYKI
ncbi:MAG: iron-sulfur cluster carrier protein [Leptospiraceae bacterium]|nr:MAG: iron-sulfur cluster carrier protein [Leptospiraceae bacterium]